MKHAALFALSLALTAAAHAGTAPRLLIDRLGLQTRQALAAPSADRTPQDIEREVAGEIAALVHASPGHVSLTETDAHGRTPLMLAVSGGYLQIVQALLTDASVRRQINQTAPRGETAWMLAQFAPGMTLAACQPGVLTLDRYPLLAPYLRRMAMLMTARKSVVVAIAQALEEAGAQAVPEAARARWLARCPNSTPALREALATDGDLLNTLVNEALARQLSFNKAYAAGLASIPQRPPQHMRFIDAAATPSQARTLRCPRMPAPAMRGALGWAGNLRLKAVAATRAGVVEVVDISVLSDAPPDTAVVDHFRGAIVRALAGYHCEGDQVFEQEFSFRIE